MTDTRPDLLSGWEEIGEHLGKTERQAEHLASVDPTMPTFKIGRKVCALRSRVDAWLAEKADAAALDRMADDGGRAHE